MRQRKIKNLEDKLEALSMHVVNLPEAQRGQWHNKLGTQDVRLEIGCGKGKFIDALAARTPDAGFVAVEGNLSVAYHALEKIHTSNRNVLFILQYINAPSEIFAEGELNGIYLNFSDPWPKVRHEKRRLTTATRLLQYAEVLAAGGLLEFKTDNDGLFEYTLTQVGQAELPEEAALEDRERVRRVQELYEMCFVTRDLHRDVPAAEIVTTEYEEKFAGRGKNINFLRLRRI
jgi:tRNA (guanine-N7-)-methyltransferase